MNAAGFAIDIKCEDESGYGMEAYAGNLHLTGWPDLVATNPREWPARNVQVVYANPPCSAFSNLLADPKYSDMGSAGMHGRQNSCMFDVINYAARCHADVVVIESVQAAGRQGRPLMKQLRKRLEGLTRHRYHLTYIFMNTLSVGGWQIRPRFFFVASRIGPCSALPADGWSRPVSEAIGDLQDDTWTSGSPRSKRLGTLAAFIVPDGYERAGESVWPQGKAASEVYAEAVPLGYRPWDTKGNSVVGRSDLIRSPFTAWRWRWDQPAQVVTGGFMEDRVHPLKPRTFTYRETARLMGFPDDWRVEPVIRAGAKGRAFFGKGVTVHAATWIGKSVLNHVMGVPSAVQPIPMDAGEDEYLIDVTDNWKHNRPPFEQLTLLEV
jgi:site-specific DNA-cytosine methylase